MDTDNLGSGLTRPNGRAAGAGEYTAKVVPNGRPIAAAADAMASIVLPPAPGATGSGAGPAAHLGVSMGGGSFWYKYA